jgi:hexulose-6-phosphate isomerase
MQRMIDRRAFLGTAMAAGAAAACSDWGAAAKAATPSPFKKAVKIGMVKGSQPLADKFQMLKELGYDGVELDSPNNLSVNEVIEARDKSGLAVHGVVDSVHWRDTLSHPDPVVRARGVKGLETAIRDSKAYGGTTVLLVPAVVDKEVSYDQAYTRSQAEIRRVLPLAEEQGIRILFENVWNQFLLSPLEAARYIDEFESPVVGAYFDVGNVVNYGWPEQWVRILGPRIGKLDIKEFSRKRRDDDGLWKGFDVEIGEGDCDWPAVVQALQDIQFQGWATAEVAGGERKRLGEIAKRMDRVLTG